MAQAYRYTGKNLYATLASNVIYADYKSIAVKEDIEDAGATAGADAHEFSLPTYRTSEIEVEFFGVTKSDAQYSNIETNTTPGATGSLIWGPEGNTSGKPKFTATGFVKSRSKEFNFDDTVNYSFTFKCNAAIGETTF